jgi:hypothetical protein
VAVDLVVWDDAVVASRREAPPPERSGAVKRPRLSEEHGEAAGPRIITLTC